MSSSYGSRDSERHDCTSVPLFSARQMAGDERPTKRPVREAESLGWLSESAVQPKKQRFIEGPPPPPTPGTCSLEVSRHVLTLLPDPGFCSATSCAAHASDHCVRRLAFGTARNSPCNMFTTSPSLPPPTQRYRARTFITRNSARPSAGVGAGGLLQLRAQLYRTQEHARPAQSPLLPMMLNLRSPEL